MTGSPFAEFVQIYTAARKIERLEEAYLGASEEKAEAIGSKLADLKSDFTSKFGYANPSAVRTWANKSWFKGVFLTVGLVCVAYFVVLFLGGINPDSFLYYPELMPGEGLPLAIATFIGLFMIIVLVMLLLNKFPFFLPRHNPQDPYSGKRRRHNTTFVFIFSFWAFLSIAWSVLAISETAPNSQFRGISVLFQETGIPTDLPISRGGLIAIVAAVYAIVALYLWVPIIRVFVDFVLLWPFYRDGLATFPNPDPKGGMAGWNDAYRLMRAIMARQDLEKSK